MTSGSTNTVEQLYELAKRGSWPDVRARWTQDESLALRCSRFVRSTSGWTFLHQAAWFGVEPACRDLIRLGAAAAPGKDGRTPSQVATAQGNLAIAALLDDAARVDSLWEPPRDPGWYPSSPRWSEATERHAARTMTVAYGGGGVQIEAGRRYHVDSFERTLVGWHGTFDPPRGMDGQSML
jgi:hypothetical protein